MHVYLKYWLSHHPRDHPCHWYAYSSNSSCIPTVWESGGGGEGALNPGGWYALFVKKKTTTTTTKTKQKQTNKVCQWQERAHNPERAPPILERPMSRVFTDRFIFKAHFRALFLAKMESPSWSCLWTHSRYKNVKNENVTSLAGKNYHF